MKYFHYLILMLGFMCMSCSEDDNATEETVKPGSYNYIEGDNVISLYFKDGGFSSILIFTDGEVSYQSHTLDTEGSFPEYTAKVYTDGYHVNPKLEFSAKYNNKTFNAVTSGTIEGNLGKMINKTIEIPRSLILKYDQSVLDKNGDGILDIKQNL